MDTKNYYSGGNGNEIGLKFQSDFLLFNNFMGIEIDSEIKYFFNRVNYSMINPIEMVPMIINENDHGPLLPIYLVNSALRAKVSTVIFEFRWTNLSEIILSSMQSDKDNFFHFIHRCLIWVDKLIFQLTGNFKISYYKLQSLQVKHLLQKFVIIHLNY